jgi:hypothetical protein
MQRMCRARKANVGLIEEVGRRWGGGVLKGGPAARGGGEGGDCEHDTGAGRKARCGEKFRLAAGSSTLLKGGAERSRGGVRESGDAWGRAWFALAEAGGLTSSLSSSHTQTDGPHLGVQDQEVPPLTVASAGRGNIERGCRQYHQITPCLLQMESLPWEQ